MVRAQPGNCARCPRRPKRARIAAARSARGRHPAPLVRIDPGSDRRGHRRRGLDRTRSLPGRPEVTANQNGDPMQYPEMTDPGDDEMLEALQQLQLAPTRTTKEQVWYRAGREAGQR